MISNTVWLGLMRPNTSSPYLWSDQSISTYTNWAVSQPDSTAPGMQFQFYNIHPFLFNFSACAYINSDGYWYDGDCNAVRSVICKQLPVGLNYSCACLGKSDTYGLGGTCGYWNGSTSTWCYVNQVRFSSFFYHYTYITN